MAKNPARGLSPAEPLPWGSCPEQHRLAQSPQGQSCKVVGTRTSQPQIHHSMGPLARLGPPVPPPTSPASWAPYPARSPAGTLGLLPHLWGLPWLPSTAGLVRNQEERPQGGAEAGSQEGQPSERGPSQAQLEKGGRSFLKRLPAPLFPPGCAHPPAGMTTIPVAALSLVGDYKIPKGGKDRVLCNYNPRWPSKVPGLYRGLGTVAEWLKIKSRTTLVSESSCEWQAAP